jgi:subtilase family serine protease
MIPTRRQAGIAALTVVAAAAAAGVGTYVPGSAAAHGNGSQAVCGTPAPGSVRCHSRLLTRDGQVVTNATPRGYGPSELKSAYTLPSPAQGWPQQTVAIVDAYDDPNAVADVSVYRAQFGLGACGADKSVSGCTFGNGATIRKVSETGSKTSYPRANGGWAQEISLDLDMVSAVCPQCNILLVEANSASMTDLGIAVNEAVALGATEVSNSYGGNESSSDTTYDSNYFNHPGVAITVSSGDSGYGVEYPAASQFVTAVGGTSLTKASGSWTETAWSGAGSGCSNYDPQPAWQSTTSTGCSNRAVADVSADADPNTGVAVYDSLRYQGISGWLVFGGTSVASPIVASVYALAGSSATASAQTAWTATSGLHDINSGSNGHCPTLVWCTAGTGWDGPTGLGTPNGTSAF